MGRRRAEGEPGSPICGGETHKVASKIKILTPGNVVAADEHVAPCNRQCGHVRAHARVHDFTFQTHPGVRGFRPQRRWGTRFFQPTRVRVSRDLGLSVV